MSKLKRGMRVKVEGGFATVIDFDDDEAVCERFDGKRKRYPRKGLQPATRAQLWLDKLSPIRLLHAIAEVVRAAR